MVSSRSADTNITGLLQEEHPEILAEIGDGIEKSCCGRTTHVYLFVVMTSSKW